MFTPTRLGPGAIYLRALDGFFRSNGDLIRVAEIEPQILWTKGTGKSSQPGGSPAERRSLATLPQRVLTHGVGYPVGGTICDQTEHVAEFQRWNCELGVAWTSEHLSVMHVQGKKGAARQSCGFLMPPIQTEAGVRLAARNIMERRAALGLPFAFETGVNYFARREGEIPDGEFFAAVAGEADCGILLDLTNLWINQKNGRATIREILTQLPLARVWEVHLSGSEMERGYWVDAHSREIDPELIALTAEIVPSFPNLGAIIFELAPDRVASFGECAYLKEMETLNRLWSRVSSGSAEALIVRSRARCVAKEANPGLTPERWERAIAERMLPRPIRFASDALAAPLNLLDEERFLLYGHLAGSFRSGALAELLGNTIRLLLLALGKQGLEALIARYMAATPPAAFPTDEAVEFRRYMDAHPLAVDGLDDVLRFEAALIEAAANNAVVHVELSRGIDELLTGLAEGRLPGKGLQPATVLEIGVDPAPWIRVA